MGCGALQKTPLPTEAEQEIIKIAESFRTKLIREVERERERRYEGGTGSCQLGEMQATSSSESTAQVKKLQSMGSMSSMKSMKSLKSLKSHPSFPVFASESSASGQGSLPLSSLNSMESLSGHSMGGSPLMKKTVSSVTKPLRHVSHISRPSVLGSQPIEAQNLKVTLPGKVGSEDDEVVIGGGGASNIQRTRKVHRNKRGAKKKFAQRHLGNLEKEDDDSAAKDDATGKGEEASSRSLQEEERKAVVKVLRRHFLFSSLAASERDILIDQMLHVEKQKGDVVCTKGDKGDDCYIILTGICAVDSDGTQIAQLSAGHTFGELALLYDVPRTATITCISPRVVLSLIRGKAFRKSLARAKERTLNETLRFLNTHDNFSKLTTEEKMMLANALHVQTFEPGALLIDENISNTAEWMFLVQEGSIEVTDQYKNRKVLGECATISGNQMPYGEKAVLAKALTSVSVYAIGYQVLNRLFGNIGEVLRRSTVRRFLESSVPFFGELTDRQQMIMAEKFQDQNVRKGEVIVSVLADPQMVLVLDGEVIITDETPVHTSASGRIGKPETTPAELDSICPVPQDKKPHRQIVPEIDLPELEEGDSGAHDEARILHRGHVFGIENFKEGAHMKHSLVARTDGIVCRAGHDEVCRALRGCCEMTPPLTKILQLNYVKRRLQTIFPFSALYDEMLDVVIQNFLQVEYAPGASISRVSEESKQFCLIVQGEAVMERPGETPRPLERWSYFGTRQLLLNAPDDADINAAATGCSVMIINQDTFIESANVLFAELQSKCWYQDLQISQTDVMYSKKLGEGQFGVVFQVFVKGVMGETFALKCMAKSKIIEEQQQKATKLEREILSEFCHPLVVRLIVTFQDVHSVYLLMENITGGDLFTAIRDIGVLNEEHVLFFGASIVLAIEYVHSRGTIYRDLKPENIMLADDGHLRLVDFGCCSRKQRSYTFVGTPEYLAPEVVIGKGYGKAIDWWSLGVIMYEMICGPLPFGENCSDPLEVFREVLEKPLSIPLKVTPEAADLLTSLLERMPEQRLGSATFAYRNEVREHQYFECLNWDAILERSAQPPYVPAAFEEQVQHSYSAPMLGTSVGDEGCEGFAKTLSMQELSPQEQDAVAQMINERAAADPNIEEALTKNGIQVPEPPGTENDLSCFEEF